MHGVLLKYLCQGNKEKKSRVYIGGGGGGGLGASNRNMFLVCLQVDGLAGRVVYHKKLCTTSCPHCLSLSPPRRTNGYRRQNAGGNPVMDLQPIQGRVAIPG